MASQHTKTLEFYGGPLDGQRTRFQDSLKPFVIVQTIAHARNVSVFVQLFRMLFFYDHTEPPVLAVYELQSDRYRYLRSTIATDAAIDATRVCAIVQERPQFSPCSPSFPSD